MNLNLNFAFSNTIYLNLNFGFSKTMNLNLNFEFTKARNLNLNLNLKFKNILNFPNPIVTITLSLERFLKLVSLLLQLRLENLIFTASLLDV